MKDTILFDYTLAETLNEKVKKIAGHLFLFCEYDTGMYPVFSADAKFLLGVLNLYRVTVDASIVHKLQNVAEYTSSTSLRNIYKKIQPIVEESQMLRSVVAHNQGKWTGGNTCAYRQWVLERIQKKSIEGVEDYTLLLGALSDLADRLVSSLEKFIETAAQLNDKKIICAWQDLLLEFYRKDQGKRMIQHQIAEVYYARLAGQRNTIVDEGAIRKKELAVWIERRYVGDALVKKKKWADFLADTHGLCQNTKQAIQQKIEEAEQEVQRIKEDVSSKCKKREDKLTPYDYWDVYLMYIFDMLKDRLNNVKEGDSMLPDGILQEIIINDLRTVPLP